MKSTEIQLSIQIQLNKQVPDFKRLSDLYNQLSTQIELEAKQGHISYKSATKILHYYQSRLEHKTLINSINLN